MPVSSTQNNLHNEKDSKACEGRIKLPKRTMFRENSQRPLKFPKIMSPPRSLSFKVQTKIAPSPTSPAAATFYPLVSRFHLECEDMVAVTAKIPILQMKKSRNNLVLTGS